MNNRYLYQSEGEQLSLSVGWWLTIVGGVILCLW